MPTGTITYHIASEVVGIDVDDVRYRATRNSRLPWVGFDGELAPTLGTWTLWHDDRDSGSHSVGYCDAYVSLDEAVDAATRHAAECKR